MANSHWMFPANTDTILYWHCSVAFRALSFSVFVWKLSMCSWHLLLCPAPVNLLSTSSTGWSAKSAVPRSIFIFNYTLDAKPYTFLRCTCGRAKALAKFQLKSYEDVLKISGSFLKHYTVFPLTLAVSNI